MICIVIEEKKCTYSSAFEQNAAMPDEKGGAQSSCSGIRSLINTNCAALFHYRA